MQRVAVITFWIVAGLLFGAPQSAQAASVTITAPTSGEVGGIVHVALHGEFAPGETSSGFDCTIVGTQCNARINLMALSGYPGDPDLTLCWDSLAPPPSQDHMHQQCPNGQYTIEVYYEWMRSDDPNPSNPTIYSGSTSATITLRNLTVTPVTPEKILASSTPGSFPISYTLQDAWPQNTLVTVEVKDVGYNTIWSREFNQVSGGSVAWDGMLDSGGVAPPGVYLARVYGSHTNVCVGPADNHDWEGQVQVNRSALDDDQSNSHLSLGVSVGYADVGVARSASMQTWYTIEDTSNQTPLSASIEIYRPTTIELEGSRAVDPVLGFNQVFINLFLTTALDWTFLLEVLDNDAIADKDHRNRRGYRGDIHHVPACVTFGFDYPDPDPLDTTAPAMHGYHQLGLVQPEPDALPSTRSLYSGEHPLGVEGGYIQDASVARGQEKFLENSIWHFNGHGPADGSVPWNFMVFADGRLYRNFLLDKDLSRLRLALFLGCTLAANDANGGNFVDTVIARGGKSAVGFKLCTLSNQNVFWNERFWYYSTKEGQDVIAAAEYARRDTAAEFNYAPGDETGVNSMYSNSQGIVVLHPAEWG